MLMRALIESIRPRNTTSLQVFLHLLAMSVLPLLAQSLTTILTISLQLMVGTNA